MATINPRPPRGPRGGPDGLPPSFHDWEHVLNAGSVDGRPAEPAEARPFRPVVRRPMALLHVVDDGREHGEIVRLRGDRLVIGRCEGDVLVPHDLAMSPRHAVIERVDDESWQLADAASADGTFVRVVSARLRQGTVIRVGSTTLRFHEVDVTEAWLVEVGPRSLRHECHGATTTIGGQGGGCGITLADPFVSPHHAEIHRTHGGWRIDNAGLNGLWVRIEAPVRLTGPAQFQCGEQRFVFEPLRD